MSLIWSVVLVHKSSYLFSMTLLSLVETSVKDLFSLLSSIYPFLLIIMYKRFTLLMSA